jgi:predicted RNA binding protein YcfA (HicA-like mRNA interferase family)
MSLREDEMPRLYKNAGWEVLSQKGSHVKVGKDTLRKIISMHGELKKRT